MGDVEVGAMAAISQGFNHIEVVEFFGFEKGLVEPDFWVVDLAEIAGVFICRDIFPFPIGHEGVIERKPFNLIFGMIDMVWRAPLTEKIIWLGENRNSRMGPKHSDGMNQGC